MPIFDWLTGKLATYVCGALLATNLVAGAGLLITRHTLSNRTVDLATEKKLHQIDIDHWQSVVAQATADDEKHAAQVAQAQAQIATETQNALKAQIADARAVASSWLREHPAPAIKSGSGTANLPKTPGSSEGIDGSPPAAIVPSSDIEACAQDYVIANGWKEWWAKVQPTMVDSSP